MRQIAFLAAAGLLAGCAAAPSWQWVKPGATAAEFEQHSAQCDYETDAATQATDYSLRSSFGRELDRSVRTRNLFVKCMVAKGYRQESIGSAVQANVRDDCRWVTPSEYRCGK